MANAIYNKFAGNVVDEMFQPDPTEKAITEAKSKKLAEALMAARQVGQMQAMAQDLPSGEGILGPYLTGAKQWLKTKANLAPQQESYDDIREGLVAGSIGTGVAGEQRLTDVDILRYLKLIPTKWHSKETEETKYGDILSALVALAGDRGEDIKKEWASGQKAYADAPALRKQMIDRTLVR